MHTSTADPTSPSASGVVQPPPGLNYVAAIKPSLQFLLVGTILSSFLIPTTIAMFYFSNSRVRRQPIFILNVVAITLGIVEGVINIHNQTRAILGEPVDVVANTAFAWMSILAPMFAEYILVWRVVTTYPPRELSWKARIGVYGPIVGFKVARLVNEAVFIAAWVSLAKDSANPLQAAQTAWYRVNDKLDWFLQLGDTMYTSALFLIRLRRGTRNRATSATRSIATQSTMDSYSARLRTLFWIAVSNFVFPVFLNLVQLIFAFREANFLHGTLVFIVNNYVQIIGVLLATVWATGTNGEHATLAGDTSDRRAAVFDQHARELPYRLLIS